jgi:hypothetical protein
LGRSFVNLRVLCGARIVLALLLAVYFVPEVALARIRHARHVQSASDADYISALETANKFLFAWQSHDEEAGVLLLTDGLKKSSSEGRFADFFSSAPVETYEIGRGKKVRAGLYIFPLTLYGSKPGEQNSCRPRYSEVRVIKTGKEDWAIDKLP